MKFLFLISSLVGYLSLQAQVVFQKMLGDSTCYEEAFSILPTGQDKYLVSAIYNCDNPSSWNSLLISLNEQGDTLWTRKNALASGFLRKAPDNDFIFLGGNRAGLVYDTIMVRKTDQSGDTIWTTKIFLSPCNNTAYDLINTKDGGYALTGIYAKSNNCSNLNFNGFLTKLDANGHHEWTTRFVGPQDDQFFSVRQTEDSGYALFGWTKSFGPGGADFFLMKTNSMGDSLWSRTYGGPGDDYGQGMDMTPDGGFIMTGYSDSSIAIKADSLGNIEWQKTLGPRCGGIYFKALTTLDNRFAFLVYESSLTGCSSSLIKTDQNGNVLWKKNWGGLLREVYQPDSGSFLLAGYLTRFPTPSDVYVIRFDTTFIRDTTTSADLYAQTEIRLYPNPVTGKLNIELPDELFRITVVDALGRKRFSQWKRGTGVLDLNDLPPGIYLIEVTSENGHRYSKKVIIE